jgi:hypothetical protein
MNAKTKIKLEPAGKKRKRAPRLFCERRRRLVRFSLANGFGCPFAGLLYPLICSVATGLPIKRPFVIDIPGHMTHLFTTKRVIESKRLPSESLTPTRRYAK